jgi:hypothetical protein
MILSRGLGGLCLVALLGNYGCTALDDDNAFCAFRGQLLRGTCPSLCEWQCRTAERQGCPIPACVEGCEADRALWSGECKTAAHDHWICIIDSGVSDVGCPAEAATPHPRVGICEPSRRVAALECGIDDPLRLPAPTVHPKDAGPSPGDGGPAFIPP